MFRSAYFPKKLFSFFSKTLDLQVRCAHPTGVFAPKRLFKPFRCSAWLILRKEHTMLFSPKRTCFRFAALPYGCLRTETAFQAVPVFRMAYFTIPHRPTFGAPVFRSAYSTSRNARASAASRPPDSAPTHLRCAGVPLGLFGKPKRTCFRFAALTLRVQGAEGQPLRPRRRPAPPFAPKRLFKPFRCSAWLIPYRQRTALSVGKRSCFRFAALTLRVQGSRRATPQALRGG